MERSGHRARSGGSVTSQASRAESNYPVKLQGVCRLDRPEITVKTTGCRWEACWKCEALCHFLSVGFIFLIIFKDDYILSSNDLS